MRRLGLAFAVATVVGFATSGAACSKGHIGDASAGAGAGPPLEEQITPSPGGVRRILARQYVNTVRRFFGAAATYASFEKGAAYAISALLQAPDFLYLSELGEPDPTSAPPNARRRLTQTELATRMSFFLLDRSPDAKLLDLADKNGLSDDEA